LVTSPITAFIDIAIAGANFSDLLGGTQARAANPDQPTLYRRTDRSGLHQIHARRELPFIEITVHRG
jgi:hypothetical protein